MRMLRLYAYLLVALVWPLTASAQVTCEQVIAFHRETHKSALLTVEELKRFDMLHTFKRLTAVQRAEYVTLALTFVRGSRAVAKKHKIDTLPELVAVFSEKGDYERALERRLTALLTAGLSPWEVTLRIHDERALWYRYELFSAWLGENLYRCGELNTVMGEGG